MSYLVLHLVVKCQVLLHLCPKGGSVSTERTDHVAPLPLLTVLDVVPKRSSSLIHPVAEWTGLLGPSCIWSPERGNIVYHGHFSAFIHLSSYRGFEPIPACTEQDTGHIPDMSHTYRDTCKASILTFSHILTTCYCKLYS